MLVVEISEGFEIGNTAGIAGYKVHRKIKTTTHIAVSSR